MLSCHNLVGLEYWEGSADSLCPVRTGLPGVAEAGGSQAQDGFLTRTCGGLVLLTQPLSLSTLHFVLSGLPMCAGCLTAWWPQESKMSYRRVAPKSVPRKTKWELSVSSILGLKLNSITFAVFFGQNRHGAHLDSSRGEHMPFLSV